MGTLVCFHAHPDDESIATAGSMVAAAADGHPVVLVVATLGEAAGRLAAVLREEGADVVTIYDENGVYGHPDHVQVHRVGTRAAALAGTPRVLESTMNRDYLRSLMAEAREADAELGAVDSPDVDEMQLGVPGDRITTRVDVTAHVGRKRASMRAHASQISEQSFFLAMPDEAFARSFGIEWFIHHGVTPSQPWEDSII